MTEEKWLYEIKPKNSLFDLKLKEVWRYRDLLFLFTTRDFIAVYKQTILGPLWFFIQPLLTTITFTIIFGNVANIGTDGAPQILFYMSGVTCWNYFADSLRKTSDTFRKNANIFGKVYFPRLIMPLSVIISNLFTFGIQFLLFLITWIYFILFKDASLSINSTVLIFPVLIVIMAILGLSLGMIISSLTTKYRDLSFLITFVVQLLMYATPVIYPLSKIPEKYQWLVKLNPMTPVLETFKYIFLGIGQFSVFDIMYSLGVAILLFFLGLIIFNKTEKTFMDTV